MKAKQHRDGMAGNNGVAVKRVTRKGKRVVIVDESEFDRLKRKADEWEPLLPPLGEDGNYPAVEYGTALLAIKIIRHRRRLGLTQVELAQRAGIRAETLNRIEQGHVLPSIRTVDKIDRALREGENEA